MLSASVDFPGLSRLRQMGQRMAQMRQAGQQGNASNPTSSPVPVFNPQPMAQQNMPGGNYLGAGEGQQGEDPQDMMGQTMAPQEAPSLTPRPIPPPAISSLRDVKPRGLGDYRQAGMGMQRRGFM